MLNLQKAYNVAQVHINIPFEESLYTTIELIEKEPKNIDWVEPNLELSKKDLEGIGNKINESKKVLILCGMLPPDKERNEYLAKISELSQVVVITETTSNLYHENFIPCIDRLVMSLNEDQLKDFQPDLLITMGTNLISKKIKFLLRGFDINTHFHFGRENLIQDTFHTLTSHFNLNENVILSNLESLEDSNSDYKNSWISRNDRNKVQGEEYLINAPFSDFTVFHKVLDLIPAECILQMGNSSAVRYVQLFNNREDIQYFSNRGTSGIDGCTSTAVGYSVHSKKDVYLLSGDVSFIYDSNALWNNYLSSRLKIVVVNNGGGGIFRIIDGPSRTTELETFFEASQSRTMKPLCEMYDVDYFSASNLKEIEIGMQNMKSLSKASVLEIFTDKSINDKVLKDFFNHLSNA